MDLSVAPELAQFAQRRPLGAQAAPAAPGSPAATALDSTALGRPDAALGPDVAEDRGQTGPGQTGPGPADLGRDADKTALKTAAPPLTLGAHADVLAGLAADPRRWWDRVRFDPARPVRIGLAPGIWLSVVPPLATAECDCRLATLVAGEAADSGVLLKPGRIRVSGGTRTHVVRATAAGYAVSMHVRPEG